ncbi:MAG: sel1 repeat family protein [Algicola sp.]|nr:sel1 repeat family protein [Algicola sp.]
MNKTQQLTIGAVIFTGLILAAFTLSENTPQQISPQPSEKTNILVAASQSPAVDEPDITVKKLQKVDSGQKAPVALAEQQLKLHPDQQEMDYSFLSIEDLQSAAADNDRYYQFALAEKLSQNVDDLGKAVVLYRKAAAQGSVNALLRLQSVRLRQAMYVGELGSKRSKKYLKEAMAWEQVAKNRGYHSQQSVEVYGMDKDYRTNLSEAERQEAIAQGNSHYSRLLRERRKQGLGHFEQLYDSATEPVP